MRFKKIFMILCGCLLLSGCSTKSNIVAPETMAGGNPDFETRDDIILDWGEIADEIDEIYTDPKAYPFANSVGYSFDQENSKFQMTLIVEEDTAPDEAAAYAMDVIKGFNNLISEQDFSNSTSAPESFGGFFEKNELHIMVIPGNTYNDQTDYLVNAVIPAGEYVELTGTSK